MAKGGLNRWIIPCFVATFAIVAILALSPALVYQKTADFGSIEANMSFLSSGNAEKIDALSLYDYEVVFLPTSLNKTAKAPKKINIDSFANINEYTSFSANSYTNYVLNKRQSKLNKIDNVWFSSIKEIAPYYKVKDKKDFLRKKDSINISVVDVKSGQKIASEDIKIEELKDLSSFFVPTEVFLNINSALNINIADNISTSTIDNSTSELIRQSLDKAKIFQKINSGYYKLIISP